MPDSNPLASLVDKFKADAQKQLDEVDAQIAAKMAEIEPLKTTKAELVKTLKGLEPKAARTGGPGRPGGGGARQAQIIEILTKTPGQSVKQLATALALTSPNYLYRALPTLVDAGKVVKNADGTYSATIAASAAAPAVAPAPVAAVKAA